MPESAEPREIARLRLQTQGIAPRTFATPAAVVQGLLAVQAQDLAAAKWAVGARLDSPTIGQIDAAIDAREIVRSWPMRGTLHFVRAEDLGWMLSLTTDRLLRQSAPRHAELGLNDTIAEKAREIAVSALSGGRSLSRDEFQALLEENGISTQTGRGYHVIWRLAQTGTLCWGPTEGTTQRLVLLDEWVRHPRRLERDEALGEFFLRYIAGHGPATLQDFVWWSKLTVAEAKIGLAVAADQLVQRHVGDVAHWQLAQGELGVSDAGAKRRFARSVALLPAFDEYFLGYRDRELSADLAHHQRIVPGKNGVFQPIIVVAGRVVGTWRRKVVGGKNMDIRVEPFEQISVAHHSAVRTQAARYARFLGLTLRDVEGIRPADQRAAGLA